MKSSARLLVLTSFSLLTMTDVVGQVQGGDFGDHNAVYLPAGGDSSIGRCANEAPDKVIRFSLKGAGRMKAVLGAPNEYKGKASVAKRDLGWSWTNTTQAARTTLFTAPTDPAEGVGLNSNNNGQSPVLHTNYPATPEQLGAIVVDAIRPGGQSPTLSTKPGEGFRLYFDKWATCPGHPEEPNWLYYWKQLPIIDSMIQALPPVYLLDVSEGRCDSVEARVPIRFVYDSTLRTNVQTKRQRQQDPGTVYSSTIATKEVADDYVKGQGAESDRVQGLIATVGLSEHDACSSRYGSNANVLLNRRIMDSLDVTIGRSGALRYSQHPQSAIASFIELVRHELDHIRISLEQYGERMGYRDSDNDGYDDDWETNFPLIYPEYWQSGIKFKVGQYDKYQNGYDTLSCFDYSLNPPPIEGADTIRCTAGTLFEELRIRRSAVYIDSKRLSSQDWSYDAKQLELRVPNIDTTITFGNQGLQW